MLPKIKNAIIFLSIAVIMVLGYIFFIKKGPEVDNLVLISNNIQIGDVESDIATDQDFLPLLLNVKNIKLDDSILSDPAFFALIDSSIILIPDGNEGRSNPFAPFNAEEYNLNEEDDLNDTLDELSSFDESGLDELDEFFLSDN